VKCDKNTSLKVRKWLSRSFFDSWQLAMKPHTS
jgi:hypothetical protein